MCKQCDNTGYTWDGSLCHCPIGQAIGEKANIAGDARRDAFNEAVSKWAVCPECKGSGSKSAKVFDICPACGGVGRKQIKT